MASDKAQVLLALLVMGDSEDGPIRADPFGKNYTVAAATTRRPIGRIGASEAVHRILHAAGRQIVGKNLDNQPHRSTCATLNTAGSDAGPGKVIRTLAMPLRRKTRSGESAPFDPRLGPSPYRKRGT